jgi:transcriptional regulator with XRE-family HTH domain
MPYLAQRLRAFQAEHGLTRRELADALCVSKATFDSWLDTERSPPAVLLLVMDLLEDKPQMRSW